MLTFSWWSDGREVGGVGDEGGEIKRYRLIVAE